MHGLDCVGSGRSPRWHGFIANMTLARGGGFRFMFRFPTTAQQLSLSTPSALRVLLYGEEDVAKLSAEQMCWQKNAVIRQRHEKYQVPARSVYLLTHFSEKKLRTRRPLRGAHGVQNLRRTVQNENSSKTINTFLIVKWLQLQLI